MPQMRIPNSSSNKKATAILLVEFSCPNPETVVFNDLPHEALQ